MGSSRSVLLLERNEELRSAAGRRLREMGHVVVGVAGDANDATEVLGILKYGTRPVDVAVIGDLGSRQDGGSSESLAAEASRVCLGARVVDWVSGKLMEGVQYHVPSQDIEALGDIIGCLMTAEV